MKIYEDYSQPFDKNVPTSGVRVYKAGNVGKSHSVVRTPYINRKGYGRTMGYMSSGLYYSSDWDNFILNADEIALMRNRVRSKFEGKCGASSSVGASVFAEGAESVRMAVTRLESMAAIVRAMRRKDISGLKKAWRKSKRPTSAMKEAGGKWLEFSFGWGPLLSTVQDGFKATCADYPPVKVKANDRVTVYKTVASGNIVTQSTATQSIKMGYDVKVVNPNTWLLGRLDLLNPGRWIWEAIPYSFFVDYFVNIGDMIHNLDSFAGLTFTNGYTTYYHRWSDERLEHGRVVAQGHGSYIARKGPLSLNKELVIQQNPLTSSWQRGLNASSFLAQRLR